jgi:hypothetical protein
MKKRIIFPLVLCLLVLFTSNVFAAQETNITDKDLISQGTLKKTITTNIGGATTDDYVGVYCSSDIWQNYGNVGGQGFTQCTKPVETIRIISYIFEGTDIKSHDEQRGDGVSTLFAMPFPIPYDSSKEYHVGSNHWVTHDGVTYPFYTYEYL